MPKLPGLELQSKVAGPSQTVRVSASDITGGNGLQNFGNAVQQTAGILQKRAEQDEVSRLNAQLSSAQASFTTHFQDSFAKADPNDRKLAERLVNDFRDHLSKMGNEVSTQAGKQFFERTAAGMLNNFARSAASSQAELAGLSAKQNYIQAQNSLTSSLINDPSAFELAAEMHDSSIESLVQTGLPRKAAIALKQEGKTELAKAAIRGWIKLQPNQTTAELNEGRWDGLIDGDLKKQLLGEAKQELRAREVEAKLRDSEAERVLKEQQLETQNEFIERLANNQLSAKDIIESNLSPFGSGSKSQFLKLLDSKIAGTGRKNPAVFNDLVQRAFLPDDDPSKIVDENDLIEHLNSGAIDFKQFKELRAEVQGLRSDEGKTEKRLKDQLLRTAKAQLVKGGPFQLPDPKGEELLLQYQLWFFNEYKQQRKAGKSAQDLLDVNSKDYLGKHIHSFKRSQREILRSAIKRDGAASGSPNAKPVPKRKEGESMSDFLKRTK